MNSIKFDKKILCIMLAKRNSFYLTELWLSCGEDELSGEVFRDACLHQVCFDKLNLSLHDSFDDIGAQLFESLWVLSVSLTTSLSPRWKFDLELQLQLWIWTISTLNFLVSSGSKIGPNSGPKINNTNQVRY